MSKPLMLPTVEQWNERKEEILRLYIDEQWTLKLVMRAMRTSDFDPSESQYRTKLKKWKLRKPRKHRQHLPSTERHVLSSSAPLETSEPGQRSVSQDSSGIFIPMPEIPAWPPQLAREWQGEFGENECRSQAIDSLSVHDHQESPLTPAPPVNEAFDLTQLDVPDDDVLATLRCNWKSSIRRAGDMPDLGAELSRVQRAKRLRHSRSSKRMITSIPTQISSDIQQRSGRPGVSISPSEVVDFWSSQEALRADSMWSYDGGTGSQISGGGTLRSSEQNF
ncbi:MAG: hypothetical protein LQ350_008613 [Teloschistes chrysophthalmus]|nr:MAG: hypothetical protein LQ350_008613 [Niorma chrysophthalma]